MDGDIFGVVGRLGRDVADGIVRYFDEGEWDPFLAARCLDVLFSEAGGLPSLPGVLRQLDGLALAPLFAANSRETTVKQIEHIVRHANGSTLDLVLRSVVQCAVLRGEYDRTRVLECFFERLLDMTIITPRGGFIDRAGHARTAEARALLKPIAASAAAVLARRPDARRLGLARPHAQLQPDSNLLGAHP